MIDFDTVIGVSLWAASLTYKIHYIELTKNIDSTWTYVGDNFWSSSEYGGATFSSLPFTFGPPEFLFDIGSLRFWFVFDLLDFSLLIQFEQFKVDQKRTDPTVKLKIQGKIFLKSGWRTWCFSHFFHDCGLAKSQPLPLAILDSKIAKVKNYNLNVTKVHHPDVKNIFPQFHRRDPTVNQKRKCMHMRHVTTSFIFWNGSKVLPSPRFEQNYTAFRA